MKETIDISLEDIEIIDAEDYSYEVVEHFSDMPEVVKPLLKGAKKAFKKIEEMLDTAPAFINMVKASVPEQAFQAILTNEQKHRLQMVR
ncbi:MAG: hypothetical protein RSC31_08910 [Anaerovoracaceae bacterium]